MLGVASGTGCAADVLPSPSAWLITAKMAVASTVLPSAAIIFFKTPALGDGTSTLTLSVSSSQRISSLFTLSPGALNQLATVASVTLSPKVGTATSISDESAAAFDGALGAGLLAVSEASLRPAPLAILASKASTPTVVPSAATISLRTPAAGLGTSTVTLSVSNSHSISSKATTSPGFLNQVATVASVTDSPKVGTRISVVIGYFPSIVSASSISAACWNLCCAAKPVAGEALAERPT